MQIAPLNRQGHYHAPHGHHVTLRHVIGANVSGADDTQKREQHHWHQAGNAQW